VTVEEVVDWFEFHPGVVLPSWVATVASCVPNGAHPSCSAGFSERDNAYYAGLTATAEPFLAVDLY